MPRASDPSQSFDLSAAHVHSSLHRAAVEASEVCGCFYCLKTFAPSEISEWVDRGETALCPKCGIDAVIGSKSGYPMTREFLKAMNSFWF
jgi:hypothetical protein